MRIRVIRFVVNLLAQSFDAAEVLKNRTLGK